MTTERKSISIPPVLYAVVAIVATLGLLWWARSVVTPIFLAFLIAYVLDPVVDRLEVWKIRRSLGILLVLAGGVGITALFLALVLPTVVSDTATVVRQLPGKVAELWSALVPLLEERGIPVPQSTTEWIARLSTNAESLASTMLTPAGGLLSGVVGGAFSLLGSVVAALIVPVLAVYFLNDFDRITAGALQLVPPRHRGVVMIYAVEIHAMLRQFLRGQLTVMAILAVLYGGTYALLGIRLAAPIGVAAGILNFIPYLGSIFALTAGVVMSLLDGWNPGQLVGVIIAYTVVQSLEGFVITPRIVGKNVQISETWVLVALFVGGEIFGFLGVLLALPAVAVGKIFVTHLLARYHESHLFLSATPATEEAPPPNGS